MHVYECCAYEWGACHWVLTHVHVQGIEIYKGRPIFYGCGDFVDDYAVDEEYRNDLGFAYTLHVRVRQAPGESSEGHPAAQPAHKKRKEEGGKVDEKGKEEAEEEEAATPSHERFQLRRIELTPTKIDTFSANTEMLPSERAWLVKRMTYLCGKMGTTGVDVLEAGKQLVIKPIQTEGVRLGKSRHKTAETAHGPPREVGMHTQP